MHSFEILSSDLDIIRCNLEQNPEVKSVFVHPVALGDHEAEGGPLSGSPNPGYSLSGAGDTTAMRILDSLVEDGSIPRVDFLKMDMEGSEMAARRGAVETIRRFRPKLAISIYHKWEDYFVIPRFIHSLDLGYRMYLDNYTWPVSPTCSAKRSAVSPKQAPPSITTSPTATARISIAAART